MAPTSDDVRSGLAAQIGVGKMVSVRSLTYGGDDSPVPTVEEPTDGTASPRRAAGGTVRVPDFLRAKVVLLGAAGVGKSSLVRRYVSNEFDEAYRATMGAVLNQQTIDVPVGDRVVRVVVTVWDAMGRPGSAEALSEVYLSGAEGVLAVCDVTRRGTVTAMHPWMASTAEIAGDVPLLILMNKADMGPREEARAAGLHAGFLRAAPCYLTSAKSGVNVADAFQHLARRVVERILTPLAGPFDDVDVGIRVDCAVAPLTIEEVASRKAISSILAEARLERLRRRGFLRLSVVALDDAGRPYVSYAATGKPFTEWLPAEM